MASGWSYVGDRQHQEDAWIATQREGALLTAVCDGMGAATSGHPAACLAIASLRTSFEANASPDHVIDVLSEANRSILARAEVARRAEPGCDSRWLGMGTTAEVAIFVHGRVHLAHVGNGRIYRLRAAELEQLTTDHTLVNDCRRLRPDLGEDELARLPRNVIVRALGMRQDVEIDRRDAPVELGDVFLLCSDGLTAMLDDHAIASILGRRERAAALAGMLLHAARNAVCPPGCHKDNATAVVHVVGDDRP